MCYMPEPWYECVRRALEDSILMASRYPSPHGTELARRSMLALIRLSSAQTEPFYAPRMDKFERLVGDMD